jgi:branched-chain amino acid transport system substrate-binding protein
MQDRRVTRRRALAALSAAGLTGLAGCTGGDGGDGGGGTAGTEGNGDGTTAADSGGGTTMDDAGTTAGESEATTGEGTTGEAEMDDGEGTTGDAGGASGSVKIGVLQPLSGDLAYYGQQSLWGFFSGLAYKGDSDPIPEATTGTKTATVGGVDYELVIRDTQLDPATAQTAATNLVQNEEVDLLFGITSSGAATQVVQTVVQQAGVPIVIGPAASAGITSSSDTCSENVFRASENTAMDARSGGQYVANETDVSKVYLFGADYSFGQAVVNNYRTVLEDNGVEIVGERFVPQGYSEWPGLLDNAQEAGAEGIVTGFTAQTLPQLFTAFLNGDYDYQAFGGFATRITVSVIGQTLQEALGELTEESLADANVGPFTTRYHWNQYDNEINSAFVDSYTSAYGVVPDLFSSGTFTAASSIVQAVEESGSTEGAAIADALRGMTVADTPKGEDAYSFQEYNNQARSPMTIADAVPTTEESWDAPIQPSEPVRTVPADSVTIPADAEGMNCSL